MPAASQSISRVARGERTRGKGYERETVYQGGAHRQGAGAHGNRRKIAKLYEGLSARILKSERELAEGARGHGRHSDDASDETASAPEDGKENVVLRIE